MKKIIFFITPWIAFFMGGIIFSMNCNAQAMPELPLSSFEVIQGGAEDLFFLGFTNNNLLPESESQFNDWLTAGQAGYTSLVSFDDDDIEIEELSTEYKNILLNFGAIYGSNGRPLTSADHIYIGHVDNGFFSGSFYIDETGTILSDDSSLTTRLFNLRYGGYIKNTVEWIQMYDDISADIFDNSYILPYDNDFDITDRSFYLWYGYNAGPNRSEGYVFVPDIYNYGVSVAGGYTNGRCPSQIYFNDNSGIVYETIQSSSSPYVGPPYMLYDGPFTVQGYTYDHKLEIRWVITSSSDSDYNSFINSGPAAPQKAWNFNSNQFSWNTSYLENSDYVAFKQLQFEDSSSKVLNFDDTFDYNQLRQLIESLNNLQPSVNNEFDYSQPITENNYYNYTYITESYNLPNSTLPLPGGSNSPFPDPAPMPDPSVAPSIGQDIGEVDPANIRSNIPIINNLLNRFPFSIPWDIYGLISGFSSNRETPYIDTTVTIPLVNYEWHIQYDLHPFDGIASLFRTLFLISFIIGLAYFSYDHFFGS